MAQVDDPADAEIAMRTTRDGRLALLAYSALDRLYEGCGRRQPWLLVMTASLEELHTRQPFDLLLMDVLIPDEFRVT